MEAETIEQYSDLLLHLYRAGRTAAPDAFQAHAFEQLRHLIHYDAGWWATGVPGAEPPREDVKAQIFDVYLYNLTEKMLEQYNHRRQFDTVGHAAMRSPGVTLNVCIREWYPEEMWPFHDIFGFRHLLTTNVINPQTGLTTGIRLYRRDENHQFSEQERHIKQTLMPHLIEAFSLSQIEPWVRDAARELNYPLAAIVDETGSLRHAAEGFAEMLQREWPDWRGPMLPAPLRELMTPDNDRQYVGGQLVANVSRGKQRHMALVQLRSARLADHLSEQQLKVAQYSADGLNFKEIARLADLAPKTVRNYQTNIYRKLGVKNKIELAKMLKEAR